jgi:hypothetical protein
MGREAFPERQAKETASHNGGYSKSAGQTPTRHETARKEATRWPRDSDAILITGPPSASACGRIGQHRR